MDDFHMITDGSLTLLALITVNDFVPDLSMSCKLDLGRYADINFAVYHVYMKCRKERVPLQFLKSGGVEMNHST